MPGDDTLHWSERFCTGCRQLTWHYDGLCSNRDFHRSSAAFSFAQMDTPDMTTEPSGVVIEAAAAVEEAPKLKKTKPTETSP